MGHDSRVFGMEYDAPVFGMEYDALVFDLDGTLWDATEASAVGWTRAARARGVACELSAADMGRVCGLPFDACVEILFPDLSASERRALVPDLARGEEAAVREQGGRIYPDVTTGLRRLAMRGPVLLLSNCHRWYLERFLEQSRLGPVFVDTLCHGDNGEDKATNLERLRTQHGFARPAYVGDTHGDRRACEIADYAFLYAAWGFGDLEVRPAFASFGALCARLGVHV